MSGISNGRGTGPAPEDGRGTDPAAHVGEHGPDDAHTPGGAADSAGNPWAGRTFDHHDTAFEDDDGLADPALVAAIRAVADGASQAAVVDALRTARLLIPLVAEAGDVGHTDTGKLVDKTQELSIVTVAGPDGRAVMPAFTSVDAMRSWDPTARPVPVESRRVAMAAASEETQLVVLDPTAPTEFVLRRPVVWALGQDLPWTPCFEDPEVAQAFADSVAGEPAVARVELAPGDPLGRFQGAELTVGLALHPGLDQTAVQELVGRLQARWSSAPVIADRVDSMRVAIRPA
ncbi:MAG: SseB family protein [Curtobacterium sp.]